MIKDKIILFNDFTDLNLRCYLCKENTHLMKECRIAHFMCDKERVLKQLLFPFISER